MKKLVLLLILSLAASCHPRTGKKPKVVATIFPVYDLARRVAGDDATVTLLVPTSVSPHVFEVSPKELGLASDAALAVTIGLDLDPWAAAMIAQVSPKGRVLKLADRVPTLPRGPNGTSEALKHKGGPGDARQASSAADPHVWLDPQRAAMMGRAIAEELARVDPAMASHYRARAEDLASSLDLLDKELTQRSSGWGKRSIVTEHDAFAYFAARTHLDVAAVTEPKPGVRPSIRYEQQVLRRVREAHVAAVFGEPQLDPQPSKTVAGAAGVPYGVLDPLGGVPETSTYEDLIRKDLDALEHAFAEQVPEKIASDAGPGSDAPRPHPDQGHAEASPPRP